MKPIREKLRDADPLIDDPGLSAGEARLMRCVVVERARDTEGVSLFSPQPLAVVAVFVLMIAGGVATGRRLPPPRAEFVSRTSSSVGEEPRQLQFATPGGTRIIWTFNPDFTLKESMP